MAVSLSHKSLGRMPAVWEGAPRGTVLPARRRALCGPGKRAAGQAWVGWLKRRWLRGRGGGGAHRWRRHPAASDAPTALEKDQGRGRAPGWVSWKPQAWRGPRRRTLAGAREPHPKHPGLLHGEGDFWGEKPGERPAQLEMVLPPASSRRASPLGDPPPPRLPRARSKNPCLRHAVGATTAFALCPSHQPGQSANVTCSCVLRWTRSAYFPHGTPHPLGGAHGPKRKAAAVARRTSCQWPSDVPPQRLRSLH